MSLPSRSRNLVNALTILVAVVCACALCGSSLRAETTPEKPSGEKKLSTADVPKPVMTAFRAAYPKAEIKGIAQEKQDGKAMIEIESLDGITERNLLYTTEGTLYLTEEVIPASSLPEAVQKNISTRYAKNTIVSAERINQGKSVTYEVHLKSTTGTMEIVLDPAGKLISSEKVITKSKHADTDNDGEEDDDK